MRGLIVVLLVAFCIGPVVAASQTAADPDFAWGKGCPAEAQSTLDAAQAKWQTVVSVPTSPACLRTSKHKTLDDEYLRELIGSPDQGQIAYNLLDLALTRLKTLGECKDEYAEAVRAAGDLAPVSAKRFGDSYYLVRSRLELAAGLARAAISRQMTDSDTSGYCFQAMEASIDALRDAADDAQKVTGGARRSESIRKLRSVLFDAWEQAQKLKDANPIGGIDLAHALDESGLLPDSRAQRRL